MFLTSPYIDQAIARFDRWSMSVTANATTPERVLLPLPHVQFWETENSWRLDSSHCGGHRRDISCLVDASDVRAVNVLKTLRLWSNERYGDVT